MMSRLMEAVRSVKRLRLLSWFSNQRFLSFPNQVGATVVLVNAQNVRSPGVMRQKSTNLS